MTVGLDLLMVEATKVLAKYIVETVWDWGNIPLDEPIKNAISGASDRYVKTYQKRHGQLKVLGMSQSLAIESIYTVTRLKSRSNSLSFASTDGLERRYYLSGDRPVELSSSKQNGMAIANQHSCLMVLGGPGAGKSTFLRKLGLEALKGNQGQLNRHSIPVFLELKHFSATEANLTDLIVEEFRACGFPSPEHIVETTLNQGNLLILLDGLDEVPKHCVNNVLKNLQDLVTRHDGNRFVVSCRTAAYHYRLPQFTDVTLADFDDSQIQHFISKWFSTISPYEFDTAQKLWDLLQTPNNRATKELAHNPLLLTFLCLVYDRTQNLPDNQSSLYRKALNILLEEWSASKRIVREAIYQGLHSELETLLLAEIAYQTFEQNQLFFSEATIREQIQTFLSDTLDAPKSLNTKAILNAIEVQQGILVKRSEAIYSFSHLTLQEFLTAQYICDHHLVDQTITQHLDDQRWNEVFLNLAGLMGGGIEKLLYPMVMEAQSYVDQSPALQSYLLWAEHLASQAGSRYKAVAQRSVALYIGFALAFDTITDRERHLHPPAALVSILHRDLACNPFLVRNLTFMLDSRLAQDLNSTFPLDLTFTRNVQQTLKLNLEFAKKLKQHKILDDSLITRLIAGLKTLEIRFQHFEDNNEDNNNVELGIKKLRSTWINSLQLSPALINLTTSDLNTMTQYFKANQLILQCRKAAVRISQTAWNNLEQKLLTVSRYSGRHIG
ncbi:MAG: NACHT domain-containing protein [Cyanothece sp. SIO2G6]|nr:NACHT domain-containing protein [Cyanothece sp. SIO2G6]